MFERKTKIVCSLGPASASDDVVRRLILAGMNVARLNFSHGTHESHREEAERVRRVSREAGVPVALLLDTKGPEIRTGDVKGGGEVTIAKGCRVTVTADGAATEAAADGKTARLSLSWRDAPAALKPGHKVLIADGLLELDVLEARDGALRCEARNGARIGSRKNVNVIGVHAGLPIMGEQDRLDIAFGAELGFDYLAASFVSFPREVTEIRAYLETLNSPMKVIAKIESGEGLENIRDIARLADGVMVARGDLGVQVPPEQIPLAQKHIIETCRRAGKPVITATQMLDSMIVNPRPTRAELTDVANAIFDGTDAVMLSGETANGAYPVEAVETMARLAAVTEASPEFAARMRGFHGECLADTYNARAHLSNIMSRSAVETAAACGAKAIITPTLTGNTARLLSVFRPETPILADTPDERAARAMLLYWGVFPFVTPETDESEKMIQNAVKTATGTGAAGISDRVVLAAGLPVHGPHTVNTVRVLTVGSVLARASTGGCAAPEVFRARGRIVHAASAAEARNGIKAFGGEILVCRVLTEDYTPIIRIVSGVICEGLSEVSDERLRLINPRLVWLTHIRRAVRTLESGMTVTLDAKQLLVYEGTV